MMMIFIIVNRLLEPACSSSGYTLMLNSQLSIFINNRDRNRGLETTHKHIRHGVELRLLERPKCLRGRAFIPPTSLNAQRNGYITRDNYTKIRLPKPQRSEKSRYKSCSNHQSKRKTVMETPHTSMVRFAAPGNILFFR